METAKLGPSPEIYYPLLGERGMGNGPNSRCAQSSLSNAG